MNKLLLAALIASTALAIVTTKKATDAEYDRAQIKEDVRLLMNDARLAEYGRNARKYFEAHFDKKMLLDRFDECVRAGG